jgi:TetR/AcrR family transcriptional repressor of nem operon
MESTVPDTRERIIEAGSSAISAKSFNGCGLKEILDAAQVPKGSFYHYFKSKEDFGVAVIEESADQHAQFIREQLSDRRLPPLERVRRVFQQMHDYYAEHGPMRECLIAKLALEVAQLSEPMRLAIKYAYDRWSGLLAMTLREAQAAGDFSSELDPERTADLLINTWEGTTMRMQIERNLKPLDEFMGDFMGRVLSKR